MSRPFWPTTVSVGFTVTVHVVCLRLGHLSAVETVQEAMGDLCYHRSVWDGLGHAIDCSLKHRNRDMEPVEMKELFFKGDLAMTAAAHISHLDRRQKKIMQKCQNLTRSYARINELICLRFDSESVMYDLYDMMYLYDSLHNHITNT